jgi:hypothetical protein
MKSMISTYKHAIVNQDALISCRWVNIHNMVVTVAICIVVRT